MSHRVIAGTAKGKRLKMVPGDTTRPIMDRVKESLFNIIGRDIFDASFLDLFAGTGAVGIEALSRGAEHALFIDLEAKAIATIQDNLKTTHFLSQAEVRQTSAFSLLAQKPHKKFEFIYIAPPQYQKLWVQTLVALENNQEWVTQETQVIVQIDPSEVEPISLKTLELVDERRYGNTLLWFLVKRQ